MTKGAGDRSPAPSFSMERKYELIRAIFGWFCRGLVLCVTVGNLNAASTIVKNWVGSFGGKGTFYASVESVGPSFPSPASASVRFVKVRWNWTYTIIGGNGPGIFHFAIAGTSQPEASGSVTDQQSGEFADYVGMLATGTGGYYSHVVHFSIPSQGLDLYADCYTDSNLFAQFNLDGGTNGSVYKIYQGGQQVDTVTLAGGEVKQYTYNTTDPTDVNVFRVDVAKNLSNGVWFYTPSSVDPAAGTPDGTVTPAAAGSPVVIPAAHSGAGTVTLNTANDTSGLPEPLTDVNFSNVDHKVSGDPLTEGTYQQGVADIVAGYKRYSVGSGSLGSTTPPGEGDALAGIGHSAFGNNPADGVASGQGTTAGSDIGSHYPGGSQPAYSGPGGSTPNFSITFPTAFGGGVVDCNPFRSDRGGPAVDWFRSATSWLVIVTFGVWASKQVAEWTRGTSSIHQAVGNTVAAGTGGQATALLAASAMTVAIATFTVAFIGWLGGDFAFSNILSKVAAGPYSGIPSDVAWMLDKVFPVATILSALGARITWNLYAAKVFAICMAVIRFVTP